jgi:GTP-binding protein EngB required for normal cell division
MDALRQDFGQDVRSDCEKEMQKDLQHIINAIKTVPETQLSDAAKCIQNIAQTLLNESLVPFRAMYAVYGTTGAGKSSLLNALINEDSLLLTSGTMACTAVAIEVQYNDREDGLPYRAEIEMVDEQSFTDELNILKDDINDIDNADVKAGRIPEELKVSLDKVKVLFPNLSFSEIKAVSCYGLVTKLQLDVKFGETIQLDATKAAELRTKVSKYIKSTEKPGILNLWPLVKLVRIFVKSPFLKDGTIFVDLPGVQDINAARSAVASNYMQHCAGVMIVSQIHRACDDKASKDLLDQSFRRQLRLDGMQSNVTFVCTKADDINSEEVLLELGDTDEEINAVVKQKHDIRKKITEQEAEVVEMLSRSKSTHTERLQLKRQIRAMNLPDEIKKKRVRKRKPDQDGVNALVPPHKIARTHLGNEEHADSKFDNEAKEMTVNSEAKGTVTDMKPAFVDAELVQQFHTLKLEIALLTKKLEDQEAEINARNKFKIPALEKQADDLEDRIGVLCLKSRNETCRKAVKKRFFLETARFGSTSKSSRSNNEHSLDSENSDGSQSSGHLSVFCVSSSAYQKLYRDKIGKQLPIFRDVKLTEVSILY